MLQKYTVLAPLLPIFRQQLTFSSFLRTSSILSFGVRKSSLCQPEDAENTQNVPLIKQIRRKMFKILSFGTRFVLLKRYMLAKYRAFGNLDPEIKQVLHGAAAVLCYDCSNRYSYKALCEEFLRLCLTNYVSAFGLEDYFSTWFKLTLLHLWMILVRLQQSMDVYAAFKIREEILHLFWEDVDKRLKICGDELRINLRNKKDILKMQGLYVQTLVEYDEGFFSSDHVLAGAIWRCLYVQKDFDPVHVRAAIYYIRGTVKFMAYLNSLDIEDILVNGIRQWKIANVANGVKNSCSAEK
uniref:Ubiq_cyt_C_chap domain-containing protein n=1 Tax=Syphacia muris TaxID=451379 RepID=A0A0N5ASR6_9BILA